MSDLEQAVVYANGLVHCSVCVPASWDTAKVESVINVINPTGIHSRWSVSGDSTFKDGKPNPCSCNNQPSTRKHYLMVC